MASGRQVMKREETPLLNGPRFQKRLLYLKYAVYPILINIYLMTLIEITEAALLDIKPGLQLSERYIENKDSTLNVRTADYVSTAAATLQMVYQPIWFNLSGGYSISSNLDSGDNPSSYLSQEGDFKLSADRPRWSTALNGKLISTRFVDQISQYNQVVVSQTNNYTQKSGSLSGSYELDRISKVSMTYSYTGNEYDSSSLYNADVQSVSGSLSHALSANNQVVFSGSANLYSYQIGGRSKSVSAMTDWSHTFSPFTTSQIGGGAGISSGYNRFMLADAQLTRKFKYGEGKLGYNRTINSGGGYTSVPVLNQQATLNLSETLQNQLSISLSGAIGESSASSATIDFNLRFWNSGISFSYPMMKWLSGSLSFSHYDQTIHSVTEDHLSSDQVMISLTSNVTPWRF